MLLLLLLVSRSVVISEVMANPAGTSGAHGPEDRNEFVELYNGSTEAVDLFDWVIDDGDSPDRLVAWTDSTILADNPTLIINSTWLGPGQYAVVLDSEYTDPNPVGGWVRPYRFGDSALILTTRNTTIGNGLATSDPVLVVSPYGETVSTFGTPLDAADRLPRDPGDGIAWERIYADRPDHESNWLCCVDSAGATPGRKNSASSIVDLAVTELFLGSAANEPGQYVVCSVAVRNQGTTRADFWQLSVWLDRNGDSVPASAEFVARFDGVPLLPESSLVRACGFLCPESRTDLWARVEIVQDRNPTNNGRRLVVGPGQGRLLWLGLERFRPASAGFDDSLAIGYQLPEPGGRLTIAVVDLAGRYQRKLVDCRPVATSGRLSWDGRNATGAVVAEGIYVVRLEYRTKTGTVVEKLPVVVLR